MSDFAPRTDEMRFILTQVLDAPAQLQALAAFAEVDADLMRQVLEEAGKFVASEVAPLQRVGDETGARYVRVEPAWHAWMTRWPTPAHLAAEPPAEAIRMWGRLGYPRRALRLHAAAVAIVERHEGEVPASYDDLIALPGVGDWRLRALPRPS